VEVVVVLEDDMAFLPDQNDLVLAVRVVLYLVLVTADRTADPIKIKRAEIVIYSKHRTYNIVQILD
jgi:hypothetical protein